MSPTEIALAWGVGVLLLTTCAACFVTLMVRADDNKTAWPFGIAALLVLSACAAWTAYWVATDDAARSAEHAPGAPDE